MQSHKITELLGCEGTSLEIIQNNAPAEAGSLRAGYTGTHPGRF